MGAESLLVIQVPDHIQNPFDLLIADHCTHFTAKTLTALLRDAGFETMAVASDWVPKELTVVARKSRQHQLETAIDISFADGHSVDDCLRWLEQVVATTSRLARTGRMGLLGTSIAATWLCSELGEAVSFFVDEDANRLGKDYMGRPVCHPSSVPDHSHVFVALPPAMAEVIADRLARPNVPYHCPSPFRNAAEARAT